MYCILVVPKELYQLPKEDSFFAGLHHNRAMQFFRVKTQRFTIHEDLRYQLNCLRNAVSHLNYTIDNAKKFTFWDHPPKQPHNRHWEAEVEHAALLRFLHIMADAAHRVYADIRNGRRAAPMRS